MKLGKLAVLNLLCFAMLPASAQNYNDNSQSTQQSNQNTSDIKTYLKNWGAYLGYDITNTPSPTPLEPDFKKATKNEESLFDTFFGSIPTVTQASSGSGSSSGSSAGVGAPFMPATKDNNADAINAQSNLTFKNFASIGQADSVTANALIDQLPIQSDPVTQSILNILGTPDVSYCTNTSTGQVYNSTNPNNTGNNTSSACSALGAIMFQNQVVENVTGVLPKPTDYYTYAQNVNVLPQLNSNALIAPLSYSTEQSSSQNQGGNQGSPGLTAQNQMQQAANFIRYVSGSVVPTILPNSNSYATLYSQAQDSSNQTAQAHAQAVLSSYLTSLRVYAAQTSVGMSNLYYILSRRIPQQANNSGSESNPSSQALNEYRMATWRIKSGSKDGTNQDPKWIDKINQSSPAAVQKEIAILLSEINYQLYLDRQIQERILMTSSVSLLQGTKAGQPSSDLSNQTTSASSTPPASGPQQ